MKGRCAEDFNYWQTTVHPAKSQAEIVELLEDFGALNQAIMQGQAGGRYAWLIRFEWNARSYRFAFVPLVCKNPSKTSSFGGKRLLHTKQAKKQMGRIAVHFVKAILTAASTNPDALFGFMELPSGEGRLPQTAGELGIDHVASLLPEMPQLTMGEFPE